jgi:hypothetical protein
MAGKEKPEVQPIGTPKQKAKRDNSKTNPRSYSRLEKKR